MKTSVAKLLTFFIPNKDRRHHVRDFLVHLSIGDFRSLRRFLKAETRENSVLLIETNTAHGEVIAGYLKYFQDMGFNVDVLVNPVIVKENPFCRLDLSRVSVFSSDFPLLGRFFASRKFRAYKHVFLMTSAAYFYWIGDRQGSVLACYPKLREHPSLFVVEHDLNDVERFGEQSLLDRKRLIALGHFPHTQAVFAAPFLFGDVRANRGGARHETTFICIGGIQMERKNHQKLISAIREIIAVKRNFKVVIVGKGELQNLPEEIHPFCEITGRIDFPEMFEKLEKADFLLPLLDADEPAHNRYITTGVTGSAQLIYAFEKIPVVHPKFAAFYGFDDRNAIISESLAQGMLAALALGRQAREAKQMALAQLAERLKAESTDNLKEILSR